MREGSFIGDGEVDARVAPLRGDRLQAHERPARQLHGWTAGGQVDHPHIAPEHTSAQSGTERLRASFLGSEPLRVGLAPAGTPFSGSPLYWREDAHDKPLPVPIECPLDAPNVDQIGTDTDNHPRPRSMAARMSTTASCNPPYSACPIRKWPMLSSTTSNRPAMISAVWKFSPCPACTSRPRLRARRAPLQMRDHSASACAGC